MVLIMVLLVVMFAPPEQTGPARDMALYGFVIFLFIDRTLWAIGLGVYKDWTDGVLTSFYLSPASRFGHLAARAIVALLWTGLAAGLGLTLAQLIVGPLQVQRPGLVLIILTAIISGLVGLGFAMAGLALRYGHSMEIIANLIEFSLLGLCALFFPFAVLPPPVLALAKLIPLSYAVDALRTVALGQPQPELLSLNIELIIVAAMGILGPWLGYRLYQHYETFMRQQGRL